MIFLGIRGDSKSSLVDLRIDFESYWLRYKETHCFASFAYISETDEYNLLICD